MRNRQSVIPDGFENFSLENINTDFCCEGLENSDKELVLISAPADFDINTLKGEQIIPNGSKLLHPNEDENEESLLKWELHTSSACSDKHLKVLLPSRVHQKHVLTTDLSLSMNIIRNLHLPTLKSPKKKKKGTRLPKPIGLRARWKPFGSGDHDSADDDSRVPNESCNGFQKDDNEIDNSDITSNGIKMEIDFETDMSINDLNHTADGEKIDKVEDSHQTDKVEDLHKTEVNNVGDHVDDGNKKRKKKKKKIDEINDIEGNKEPEICVSNEIKTVLVKLENDDAGESISTPKKNRKRKKKAILPEQEIPVIDEQPESENVQAEGILKPKKKKKKHKENDGKEIVEKEIVEKEPSNPSNEPINDDDSYTHKKKKKKKKVLEECNNENGVDKTVLPNSTENSFINDRLQVKTDIPNQLLLNSEQSIQNNGIEKLHVDNMVVKVENKDSLIGEEIPKKQKKKKKEKTVFYEDQEGEKVLHYTSILNKSNCIEKDTLIVENGTNAIEQSINGEEVHKKRRKKKKKTISNESGDVNTDAITNNAVETNLKQKLVNGNSALLDSTKKKRRRKHKNTKELADGNTSQKRNVTDSSGNTSMTIPTCDMDSDLDSDSEAKIFGVTKKKRGISN